MYLISQCHTHTHTASDIFYFCNSDILAIQGHPRSMQLSSKVEPFETITASTKKTHDIATQGHSFSNQSQADKGWHFAFWLFKVIQDYPRSMI